MKMRAFTNTEKHAVHKGGKTIMPGMTREIDEIDHPDFKRPVVTAAANTTDPIAELAKGTVKEIIPALAGLSDEHLAMLDTLEHDRPESKQRKSLTEAIADEQLKRAQASSTMEQFAEQLKNEDANSLAELAELHKDDEQHLALITAEIDSRN